MSNDLISRSAVYNKLLELEELARNRVLDTPTNSPCYQRYMTQLNERTALKRLIADEPTAYDADRVVEQIKDKGKAVCCSVKCNDNCNDCEHGCLMNGILKSVKAGGVSDNH